jgi:hypothetical protein
MILQDANCGTTEPNNVQAFLSHVQLKENVAVLREMLCHHTQKGNI